MSKFQVVFCNEIDIAPCLNCDSRKQSQNYAESLETAHVFSIDDYEVKKIKRVSWIRPGKCKIQYIKK